MGNNDSAGFWAKHAAPAVATTEQQIAYLRSADAYRDMRRDQTASMIYTEQYLNAGKPQPKANIYSDEAQKSIFGGDYYRTGSTSKHARKQGEPAESYLRRLNATGVTRNLESLAPDEAEQIEADIAKAREELAQGDTHDDLRARLDTAEASAGLFGSQKQATQMRSALDQRTAAATDALRTGVAYEPTSPGVPRVNIAGVLQAEEQARGAAVAARYGHQPISRPQGDGFIVTTS